MKLTVEPRLTTTETDEVFTLYQAAFQPLQTLATARHSLTAEEFAAEMSDERIDKYMARHESGHVLGLATLTADVTAVPWIEPQYYAARFPEQVTNGTLFYLGYVLAVPGRQTAGVAKAITDAIFERCAARRGILAYDSCAFNDRRGVGRTVARLPARYGASIELLDTQSYYAVKF